MTRSPRGVLHVPDVHPDRVPDPEVEPITSDCGMPLVTAGGDSWVQSLRRPRWRTWATIPAIAPAAAEIQRYLVIVVVSDQQAMPLKCLPFRGPPTPWLRHMLSWVPRSGATRETQCSSGFPDGLDQTATCDPASVWCISGADDVAAKKEDAPEFPLSLGTPRR